MTRTYSRMCECPECNAIHSPMFIQWYQQDGTGDQFGCVANRIKRYRHVDKKTMTQRGNYWSVTFFNNEQNNKLPESWKLEGQLEIAPATGKEHYQGLLHTPQVRFSAIKKVYPMAHIELARDPEALRHYVHKKATRKTSETTDIQAFANPEKISRTKFFEDVLEWMFENNYDESNSRIVDDGSFEYLTESVNHMVESGADWAYCSMAVQPITRCIWRDYRVAMWDSFVEQYTNTKKDADDHEGTREGDAEDVQSVTIECADDQEASEQEDSSESEGDTSTESSGSEDDQGSGGD